MSSPVTQARATVLLADDDAAVRRIARRILEQAGYQVLLARGGREALQVARAHAGPVHLLITDVLMPGLTGNQTHHHLQELRPGVPALCISGYPDEEAVRHGLVGNGTAFLQKPFTSAALLEAVERILADPPAAAP